MNQPDNSSDELLRAAVLAAFKSIESSPYAQVRVGVMNNIVHLAGTVNSSLERTAAEELVRNIPGVRGVVNRIAAPGAPNPAREINLDIDHPA
jgi:osmotically-inducible protein OsmY